MCECLTTAGDEIDNTVLALFGHRPECAEFKFKKKEFTENLRYLIERAADRLLEKELPKLRKELEKDFQPKFAHKEKLTEAQVQIGVFNHLQHKIIAPNIELFYTGEMDVCSVMNSNLVCEYEIKLSRADFKKDFKKEHKHPIFQKIYPEYFQKLWFIPMENGSMNAKSTTPLLITIIMLRRTG